MTKHKLRNIANRGIPIEGIDFVPEPGQIVDVELTSRNNYLIQNKFYEDLGEAFKDDSPKKKEKEEKQEAENTFVGSEEKTPTIKQSKKKKKKKTSFNKEMI